MKQYRSHKIVEAEEIASAEFNTNGGGVVTLKGGDTVEVPRGFASRGEPAVGDFLVRYLPDGYMSWSPRDKFIDGYTEI